jgi:hypothetical protein
MKPIFYSAILMAVLGCSYTSATPFDTQLKNYCNAHSTEYWQRHAGLEALQTMDANSKMALFREHIHKTIKSDDLKAVIFDQGATVPLQEFYSYLKSELPKITKSPFECPELEYFYRPAGSASVE